MKSRNLRRKIRFWLDSWSEKLNWVLRRKKPFFWSEKSKFEFWEEEKSDFDLTFRFLRVKVEFRFWTKKIRFWVFYKYLFFSRIFNKRTRQPQPIKNRWSSFRDFFFQKEKCNNQLDKTNKNHKSKVKLTTGQNKQKS